MTKGTDNMTDNLERLRARDEHLAQWAVAEIESLRQQLAECQERERGLVDKANGYVIENARLTEQLAECQAREKVLRDFCQVIADEQTPWSMQDLRELLALPSDSTALDSAIKQAKREALLEAAKFLDDKEFGYPEDELRRMADELKS